MEQQAAELAKYGHIYPTHTHTNRGGLLSLGTLGPDVHSSKVGAALAVACVHVCGKHASHEPSTTPCDACLTLTCSTPASAAPTLLLWMSGLSVPRLGTPARCVCVCVEYMCTYFGSSTALCDT